MNVKKNLPNNCRTSPKKGARPVAEEKGSSTALVTEALISPALRRMRELMAACDSVNLPEMAKTSPAKASVSAYAPPFSCTGLLIVRFYLFFVLFRFFLSACFFFFFFFDLLRGVERSKAR
jgi:hypothetical protein